MYVCSRVPVRERVARGVRREECSGGTPTCMGTREGGGGTAKHKVLAEGLFRRVR